VKSTDVGGLMVHMSCFDLEYLSEILIKAPDKMFEDYEIPSRNKEYFIKIIEVQSEVQSKVSDIQKK
jgi:hypothetical protein